MSKRTPYYLQHVPSEVQVNDTKALELAFHQGPTFINAYWQLYTLELFPFQIVHFIHVVPCKLYTLKWFSSQIVPLILETCNEIPGSMYLSVEKINDKVRQQQVVVIKFHQIS